MTVIRPNLALTSSFVQGQDGWASAMNDNIDNIDEVAPVSIKAYGAVGDGVTDDTAAIIAAFAAVPSGGRVHAPNGNYLVKSQIQVDKTVIFTGAGIDVSGGDNHPTKFIKHSSMTTPVFFFQGSGSNISNFAVMGQAGNTGYGILLGSNYMKLTHVYIKGNGNSAVTGDAALALGGSLVTSRNLNAWYLEHVILNNNAADGLYVAAVDSGGGSNANAGTAISLSCSGNGRRGVYIGAGGKNTFIGLHTEVNIGPGIYIDGNSDSNVFIGGDQEQNGGGLSGNQINVASANANDNTFINVGILVPGTLISTAAARTFVVDNQYCYFRNGIIGEAFANGPEGGSPTGDGTWYSLYTDSVERVRISSKSGAPKTGLSCGQFVFDQGNNTTHITSRDVGTGNVKLSGGAGLTGYLQLVPVSNKLECTESLVLLPTGNTKGYIEVGELSSAPVNGAANTCRLYVRDNGAGKTQLYARFGTGAEVTVTGVVEP